MLTIIQNDPEVPPGNLLDTLSVPYRIHHPYGDGDLPELAKISALIVLGGAMGANDDLRHPFLSDVKKLIRGVVIDRIPYLGICLGGQLLASVLGSAVVSNRWEEQGTRSVDLTADGKSDHLFKNVADHFTTFQWHHDSFDLPEGGVLLASSPECPHQAFRFGCNAWGLQFHPEVTEEIIRTWCRWGNESEVLVSELVAAFTRNESEYRSISCSIMTNFRACL
jgi:GMP synthase-like glutamine amidotransferase